MGPMFLGFSNIDEKARMPHPPAPRAIALQHLFRDFYPRGCLESR